MLTQTVTITQNSTPNIIIGRRSTYETQQVIFDISWLIQTYGEGTAELLIKRPKDASAYPVVAALDGNTLTWTVSDTDTQDKGHGECEIYWYVNGGLAKSCICGITILRDIGDTTETAPDPYETWVDELARLGAETLTNAQAAEQSANDAAQSASEADNSAAAALESEENALNSENAAKASEQAAATSKQGAEQSATAARQSATEADQSATNAHDDATDASASADRAEQAAASIEGDTERAEAAAQTAQGAASDASGFAGTASTKATEAAGSAATAEQAASTATQKAADASAAATAADDSASSASASATAAGNAQTAAETAQGKAEDAQEAAETAAQSIEDSAAQIDQNAEDILNLKSAINAKAGILRDTVSGSVASFVPDSTVTNLLGLSVALEPIQDLHGYDSPWPGGGGKNKAHPVLSANSGGYYYSIADEVVSVWTPIEAPGYRSARFSLADVSAYAGQSLTFSCAAVQNEGSSIPRVIGAFYDAENVRIGSNNFEKTGTTISQTVTVPASVEDGATFQVTLYCDSNYGGPSKATYSNIQLELGSTATSFSPFENLCPISGRESVEVEAAGVNLFDKSTGIQLTSNNILVARNTGYGVPFKFKKNVAYTISCNSATMPNAINIIRPYTSTSIISNSNSYSITFTPTEYTEAGINFYWINGRPADATDIQLELGSTASEYKPYSGTTHTIQLGQTVYGGTLDVTNGVLTVDRAMVDMGTLYWRRYNYSGVFCFYAQLPNMKAVYPYGLCESYEVVTPRSPTRLENGEMILDNGVHARYIYLRDDAFSDVAAFKAAMSGVQLCYELETPTPISTTPTEISTVEGQNNVFSPDGGVTVEYAADLKTYIDQKIAAAVAALS